MIEEFEQLEPNDCVSTCRPNHVRVETPWRHASDRVCARIGAALHTLDHQFSKSRRTKKLRVQMAMLTRLTDLSQGGLPLEDTGPGMARPPTRSWGPQRARRRKPGA